MFFSIAIQHTQMKWASKIIVSFRFRVALYTRILFKCHTQIWCSSFLFFIKWTNVNNFAKISKYTHDNSEMFPLRLMVFSFLFSGCLNNFVFINKYGLGENVKQKYTMFSLGSSELPCCLIHVWVCQGVRESEHSVVYVCSCACIRIFRFTHSPTVLLFVHQPIQFRKFSNSPVLVRNSFVNLV